ncbi:fasciclin domain-containing protein [Candidatus Phycosocius spiralis]|uniref:FAS1 domain-containing protein n=1 Tax=Candidatus Phycosocius spiralis TaxID=2815099 RepID=A0ABQ4PT05_9PROT|nr:fasciclin domain-containing protein [Candidatus Phycosocius spiralis]GIU66111.1 hypothetical protein PsB1_0265 [Candidatus Phycosocius spiralis]
MSIFKMFAVATVVLAVSTVPALSHGTQTRGDAAARGAGAKAHANPGTIVEVAVRAGSFKTLAAALGAAGLVDTLNNAGPYTVFAPTDAAFAKLPAGTVETLLKPENRDRLTAILSYHVVAGKVTARQLVGRLSQATTVQGGAAIVDGRGGQVTVNGVKVIAADVAASNGVIHVIDTVLMPPSAIGR